MLGVPVILRVSCEETADDQDLADRSTSDVITANRLKIKPPLNVTVECQFGTGFVICWSRWKNRDWINNFIPTLTFGIVGS
ncbi:hypothetical protein OUZ56_020190 [Daphnia magna]|uniref:Uncharacterized protein n=1 Tax=Daphnia magna TaxID=35525 RepID=A0ABQ9ZDT4_9CRUS|nr:hypothetical protein OUZ56_020190 [Daphnia magna]